MDRDFLLLGDPYGEREEEEDRKRQEKMEREIQQAEDYGDE